MADMASRVTPWPEETMKAYRWLDACLLAQPATDKIFHPAWQAYQYRLRGKMYAYIGVNDKNGRPILTLKLEPGLSELLRREYDDILPGYYMNKHHWSSAYLDGNVPQDVLEDMVRAAYKWALAALSKRARQEILDEDSV